MLYLRTELCIFPLNGGTGLCSQAGARSCVEHSRNVWHPVSYAGCTLGGWCHAHKKSVHMSRHKSHQANISARLRRRNRDSRSSPRSAMVIEGTCIFQRFILNWAPPFFFQPHWCSCTRNINPTWEVWGPVAKASMGRPESKPQPFSVMSHGYKDFPTRIRSHDRSAAMEMLIWFGLCCEGVTNYCSSARRHCDRLSLRVRAYHAWIAGVQKWGNLKCAEWAYRGLHCALMLGALIKLFPVHLHTGPLNWDSQNYLIYSM